MGWWRRMRNKFKNRSSKKSARPMRFAGHGSPFDDVYDNLLWDTLKWEDLLWENPIWSILLWDMLGPCIGC